MPHRRNRALGVRWLRPPSALRCARSGTVFTRAYVQQAVCAPSRNSFMSGRRPDTIQVWNFIDTFRSAAGGEYWIYPNYY